MKTNKKRNKLRVIQISGFRGILSACFVVSCLVAGFVGFPALAIYKLWNHFGVNVLPQINFFQGLILWAILAVSYLILNQKHQYLTTFEPKTQSPAEIKNIINEIKGRSVDIKNELENKEFSPMDASELKVSHSKNVENSEDNTKEVI